MMHGSHLDVESAENAPLLRRSGGLCPEQNTAGSSSLRGDSYQPHTLTAAAATTRRSAAAAAAERQLHAEGVCSAAALSSSSITAAAAAAAAAAHTHCCCCCCCCLKPPAAVAAFAAAARAAGRLLQPCPGISSFAWAPLCHSSKADVRVLREPAAAAAAAAADGWFFFNLFYLVVALAQLVPILQVEDQTNNFSPLLLLLLLPLLLVSTFSWAVLVLLLQVGPLFTYLAPLAFVLLASLAKEAYDDIKRYVTPAAATATGATAAAAAAAATAQTAAAAAGVWDKELNGQQYRKLLPTGLVAISASDIRVGDVVQVNSNQRVPADLVFLRTTEKSGSCFIRTDQLDGETDWKLRRAVHVTQHLGSPQEIVSLEAQVLAEAPRQDIYEFTGRFSLFLPPNTTSSSSSSAAGGEVAAAAGSTVPPAEEQHEQQHQDESSKSRRESSSVAPSDIVVDVGRGSCGSSHVEPLGLENVLWANTVVASGSVFGLVIYTGRETRASMNASQATTKVGLFDLEVNLMSKILFGVLCLLSFALVALRGLDGIWGVYLCRFVLLLSSIIPISLQVNLIIAKTLHSVNIMRDGKMAGSVVRSSTLPEELGRIDCLLTDKTGTLTQNEMHFKKLHIGRALFGDDGLEQLRQIVEQHYENASSSSNSSSSSSNASAVLLSESSEGVGGPAAVRRSRRSELQFQAASPDEVALVQFASDVGLRLVKRDEHTMIIQLPGGQQCEYQVLQCFPFSSEWKRMGIIVQEKASQRIFFYVKGAESVMLSLVRPKGSQWLGEECDNFARQGAPTQKEETDGGDRRETE
ncbi:hypothetical protein Emed_006573 [Eimeria media]